VRLPRPWGGLLSARRWLPPISNVSCAVNNQQQNPREPSADAPVNLRSPAGAVVAAALGAFAGGLAASRLPSDKVAWTGFVLVPLLLLLELCFKRLVILFAGNAQAARFTLAGAIVVALYAAWFAVRTGEPHA
jgi:hypothetical protein